MTRLKELTEVALRAAQVAIGEDCAAAIVRGESGQLPRGVLVITYDTNGAYRICGNGLPVHEAIGILQRCCMGLHESVAASEGRPDAAALPRKSE